MTKLPEKKQKKKIFSNIQLEKMGVVHADAKLARFGHSGIFSRLPWNATDTESAILILLTQVSRTVKPVPVRFPVKWGG